MLAASLILFDNEEATDWRWRRKGEEGGRIESLKMVKFPSLVESSQILLMETIFSTPFNPNSNGHLWFFSKTIVQSAAVEEFEGLLLVFKIEVFKLL